MMRTGFLGAFVEKEYLLWLVGNEGLRYPISPYIYPLRDSVGYLIPMEFPTPYTTLNDSTARVGP